MVNQRVRKTIVSVTAAYASRSTPVHDTLYPTACAHRQQATCTWTCKSAQQVRMKGVCLRSRRGRRLHRCYVQIRGEECAGHLPAALTETNLVRP